jgi:hypothetical protein
LDFDQKWLVPRYAVEPGKLLVLGAILTDPENPETSLFWPADKPVPVPDEQILDGSMAVRQQIHSELSTNTSALLKAVPPNSPLFNAGLKVEGKSSDEVSTTVEALGVTAKYFIPGKTYMEKALATTAVKAKAKELGLLKSLSLFMVVGVATAKGLTVTEDQSHESSVATSAQISAQGAELEAELSHGKTAKAGGTLKVDSVCDFAYRVRRFEYSKWSGTFKDRGDHTEGAMFRPGADADKNAEAKDAQEEEILVFEGFADTDIDGPDSFTLTTAGTTEE